MMTTNKIQDTEGAWDSGALGRDEEFVGRVELNELELDEAIGLKSISIRMPVSLIDDLKDIAQIHGLGYQPLMKQVLTRFVEAEKKQALREKAAEAALRAEEGCPDDDPSKKAECA